MKKDKKWLKEEVDKLNLVDTVFQYDGVSYIDTAVSVWQVYDLIDELDETEKVGYDIEKEKLYRVEMHGTTDVTLLTLEGNEYYFDEPLDYVGERPNIRQEFTESEIKAFDERFWQFAVKVE